LTQVNGIHVIDRTSSFQFRDKQDAIDEMGEKLHVDYVLEGSFQKWSNSLKIIAQLINVKDHTHIFSNPYTSEIKDIFAILTVE